MKSKIKYIVIAAALIAGVTIYGCKKSFLDTEPHDGSLNDITAFKTAEQFNQFIIGAYAQMQPEPAGGRAWTMTPNLVMTDVMYSTNPTDLTSFMTPGNEFFREYWANLYSIIANANIVIAKIDGSSIAEDKKTLYKAEAKFLRGFSYFMLVRAYGTIPMPLAPFEQGQLSISSSTEQEGWNNVIADLTDAAAGLPEANEWGDENKGRASKGSALAYLGNAYMYLQDWVNAKTTFEALMALNNPKYRMLDNVREVFSVAHKNTDESLFEVQFRNSPTFQWGSTPNNASLMNVYSAPREIGGDYAPWGGWGDYVMKKSVVDAYDEPADQRRLQLVKIPGETYEGELMSGPCFIDGSIIPQSNAAFSTKFWLGPNINNPSNDVMGEQNVPMMRFSEVKLNYSEVLFKTGNVAGAYRQLDDVRNRAGLPDLPVQSSSEEQFMTTLMNERRKELLYEGNLWFHYTRTGRAAKYLKDAYNITMVDRWKFFPIPQAERDLNPNLASNGY